MIEKIVITYRVTVTSGTSQSFSFKSEEKMNAFILLLKENISYIVTKRTTTEEITIVK